MGIMDNIRRRQALVAMPARQTPPKHQPEMLYFGCVDARLDPIDDIGIDKGKALIYRNIGALIFKDEIGDTSINPESVMESGEIPQNVGIGAVLEFFLHYIPYNEEGKKHIVVSGHTDCGGIRACRHGITAKEDYHLAFYLMSLAEVRARVMAEAEAKGWDESEVLHALEEEAVRQSMRNLMTYPVVRQELNAGKLELHGWVINTASQGISEMNPETLRFEPMAGKSK